MNLGVAILAAGASTRMGRPKMLLPWGDTSVIGHIISTWERHLRATQVSVICAPAPAPVIGELDRLLFPKEERITNPTPECGMLSSVQTAAHWPGWNPGLTHFALVLGDQPHLSEATLRELLDAACRNPGVIHQPSFRGRARHPVIFPAAEFRSIATTKQPTLRDFLQSSERTLVPLEDPGLNLDLDFPSDYEAARELTGRNLARQDG
jgi:molybdenum cofactor cytidylyltransferase